MIRKGPEGNTLVLLWLLMLAEAGKCNRGGYLMISDSLPYNAETLSMVTDIALPTVQLGLTIFAGLGRIRAILLGGWLLGLVQSAAVFSLGSKWRELVSAVLLLLLLYFRPEGISLKKEH